MGDVFCIDWSTATFNSPSAGVLSTIASLGFNVTDSPVLMSPLTVVGGTMDARLGAATANTCTQDISVSTADDSGSWNEPEFSMGPSTFTLPLVVGSVTLHGVLVGGDVNSTGSQIVFSTVTGAIELPSIFASTICALATCSPCPVGTGTCMGLDVENATWNNVGSGPLLLVP